MNANKTYYIETYGCQMNVYDSELISSLMKGCGYDETDKADGADAIFLNTCSIREKAEETVHNHLSNYHHLKKKKPEMLIGVVGCMAQNLKDTLLESKPFIDIILGPDSYRRIPEIINQRSAESEHVVDTRLSKFELYDDLFPSRKEGVNAWISIMRGCDKFCTFCIVPFTRGRERSRSVESVVEEAKKSVSEGFVEITLLGQNVNSYRTEGGDFSDLLEAVACVEGVKRIRFTSPHPQDIDDRMIETIARHHNICNYIHLPLQAGSDRVLKRMNRSYTSSEFLELVNKIRKNIPNCSLSTDIIVGFPGETEEDFKDTLDLMCTVNFNSAFMFKYSSRPGTKAAEYSDQIDEDIKQRRLEKLIRVQKVCTKQANTKYIGKTVSVLVEKESKKSSDQWAGRTDGNTWVVFNKGDTQIKEMVDVKIEDAHGVTLFGKITNQEYINEVA